MSKQSLSMNSNIDYQNLSILTSPAPYALINNQLNSTMINQNQDASRVPSSSSSSSNLNSHNHSIEIFELRKRIVELESEVSHFDEYKRKLEFEYQLKQCDMVKNYFVEQGQKHQRETSTKLKELSEKYQRKLDERESLYTKKLQERDKKIEKLTSLNENLSKSIDDLKLLQFNGSCLKKDYDELVDKNAKTELSLSILTAQLDEMKEKIRANEELFLNDDDIREFAKFYKQVKLDMSEHESACQLLSSETSYNRPIDSNNNNVKSMKKLATSSTDIYSNEIEIKSDLENYEKHVLIEKLRTLYQVMNKQQRKLNEIKNFSAQEKVRLNSELVTQKDLIDYFKQKVSEQEKEMKEMRVELKQLNEHTQALIESNEALENDLKKYQMNINSQDKQNPLNDFLREIEATVSLMFRISRHFVDCYNKSNSISSEQIDLVLPSAEFFSKSNRRNMLVDLLDRQFLNMKTQEFRQLRYKLTDILVYNGLITPENLDL